MEAGAKMIERMMGQQKSHLVFCLGTKAGADLENNEKERL